MTQDNMPSHRAALYCRVSSHAGDTDDPWASLPRQEEKLRQMAERDGAPVAIVYREVYSGTKDSRPDFQDLMTRLALNEVQAVYVVSFDRLTRNGDLGELESLRRDFSRMGCDVLSPNEAWRFSDGSGDTPEGKLNFRLRGVISGFERDVIERRMRQGKEKKAESGGYIGHHVPYGYADSYHPTTGKKVFAPHPEEAAIVQRIFAEYVAGKKPTTIARELVRESVPKKSKIKRPDADFWHVTSIQRILDNSTYAGLVGYLRGGQAAPLVPSTDFPALIDMETWEAAKARRQVLKVRNARGPHQPRPLSGILRCQTCGSGMASYRGKSCWYYKCSNQGQQKSPCSAPQVLNMTVCHVAVLTYLQQVLPDRLSEERRIDVVGHAAKVVPMTTRARIEKRIEQAEAKLSKLIDWGLVGRLQEHELDAKLEDVRVELEVARTQLAELEQAREAAKLSRASVRQLKAIVDVLQDIRPDHERLRDVFDAAIIRVVLQQTTRGKGVRQKIEVERLQLVTEDWV